MQKLYSGIKQENWELQQSIVKLQRDLSFWKAFALGSTIAALVFLALAALPVLSRLAS